jgi:hypothetical protein
MCGGTYERTEIYISKEYIYVYVYTCIYIYDQVHMKEYIYIYCKLSRLM